MLAGLIEFVESRRSLDDYHAPDVLKDWLRQDIALWRAGDLRALPMGYLLCGPVGTGKTYLVECLAGEAGVPVVKLKNFRDRWVGSSEGNLEKIFRLIRALGRCIVFIDEADQTLGRRDSGSGDSGLSGRLYSMIAQEMSDSGNRGRLMWMLASSRPDLIEVDLGPRAGGRRCRCCPASAEESAALLGVLLKRRHRARHRGDGRSRAADPARPVPERWRSDLSFHPRDRCLAAGGVPDRLPVRAGRRMAFQMRIAIARPPT